MKAGVKSVDIGSEKKLSIFFGELKMMFTFAAAKNGRSSWKSD